MHKTNLEAALEVKNKILRILYETYYQYIANYQYQAISIEELSKQLEYEPDFILAHLKVLASEEMGYIKLVTMRVQGRPFTFARILYRGMKYTEDSSKTAELKVIQGDNIEITVGNNVSNVIAGKEITNNHQEQREQEIRHLLSQLNTRLDKDKVDLSEVDAIKERLFSLDRTLVEKILLDPEFANLVSRFR